MTQDQPPRGSGPLQFERAEFAPGAAGALQCAQCQAAIADQYFELGGRTLCERCRGQIEAALASGASLGSFGRATLFGLLAAVLGAVVWYAVQQMSDKQWSLIAIAVGFIVGGAVRRGSRGLGGLRYQLLAVALTYVSITGANVPYVIGGFRQAAAEQRAQEKNAAAAPRAPASAGQLLLAYAFVLAIACIAPFLGGFQNIMGLVIIAIGLYQAWRMNKGVALAFSGPFRVGAGPAAPASGA